MGFASPQFSDLNLLFFGSRFWIKTECSMRASRQRGEPIIGLPAAAQPPPSIAGAAGRWTNTSGWPTDCLTAL